MVFKMQESMLSNFAEMMSAMGTEPRLRIMRLLLSAYPEGMVVGDIQTELGIPSSTLSHHLEKLKIVGLVRVNRERQFLRYSANTEALKNLMAFLFDECCSRSHAIKPQSIANLCGFDKD
jgi:ArsR family transcriptional regulator